MQVQAPAGAASEPPQATAAAPRPTCPKQLAAASMKNRTRTNYTDAGPAISPAARTPASRRASPSPVGSWPQGLRAETVTSSLPREYAGVTVPLRASAAAHQLSAHRPPPAPRAGGSQAHQRQPHRTPGHLEDEEAGSFTQTRQGG